jgi:hypothetical protein
MVVFNKFIGRVPVSIQSIHIEDVTAAELKNKIRNHLSEWYLSSPRFSLIRFDKNGFKSGDPKRGVAAEDDTFSVSI